MQNLQDPQLVDIQVIRDGVFKDIQQLTPERLQVVADFVAYLADRESEEATQELLNIVGVIQRLRENRQTPKIEYINWRSVRSDV